MSEAAKYLEYVLSLGDCAFTAFFRNQETAMNAVTKLPYMTGNPPSLSSREGTACRAFSNIISKDGSKGLALVTGGNLTNEEIQTTITVLKDLGQDQTFILPDRFKALGTNTPAVHKKPWWKFW